MLKRLKAKLSVFLAIILVLSLLPNIPVHAGDTTVYYKCIYSEENEYSLQGDAAYTSITAAVTGAEEDGRTLAGIVVYSEDSSSTSFTYLNENVKLIISNVSVTAATGGIRANEFVTLGTGSLISTGEPIECMMESGLVTLISDDAEPLPALKVTSGSVTIQPTAGTALSSEDDIDAILRASESATTTMNITISGTAVANTDISIGNGETLTLGEESTLTGANNGKIQFGPGSAYVGAQIFNYYDGSTSSYELYSNASVIGKNFEWDSTEELWKEVTTNGGGGGEPGPEPGPGPSETEGILNGLDTEGNHQYVISSALTVDSNEKQFCLMTEDSTITISSGGSLTIANGFNSQMNNGTLTVAEGGSLIVLGELEISYPASISVAGTFTGGTNTRFKLNKGQGTSQYPGVTGISLYDSDTTTVLLPEESPNWEQITSEAFYYEDSKWVQQMPPQDHAGALEPYKVGETDNYVITSDVTISSCENDFRLGGSSTITINESKTLTIGDGVECNFSGTSFTVNGALQINGTLEAWGTALNTAGTGSIIGGTNGILRFDGDQENVPTTNLSLYDTDEVTAKASPINGDYKCQGGKWVFQNTQGGGGGGEPQNEGQTITVNSVENGAIVATASNPNSSEAAIVISEGSSESVPNGWDLSVTFTPDTNYELTDINVADGGTNQDGSPNEWNLSTPDIRNQFVFTNDYKGGTFNVTAVDRPYTIGATFAEVNNISCTINSGANGTLIWTKSTGNGSNYWEYPATGMTEAARTIEASGSTIVPVRDGDNLAVKCTPVAGYQVDSIMIDGQPVQLTNNDNYDSSTHTLYLNDLSYTTSETHNISVGFSLLGAPTTADYDNMLQKIQRSGYAVTDDCFALAANVEAAKTSIIDSLVTQFNLIPGKPENVTVVASNLTVVLQGDGMPQTEKIFMVTVNFGGTTTPITFPAAVVGAETDMAFSYTYAPTTGADSTTVIYVYIQEDIASVGGDIEAPQQTPCLVNWFACYGLEAQSGNTVSTDKINCITCSGSKGNITQDYGRMQFHMCNANPVEANSINATITLIQKDYQGVRFAVGEGGSFDPQTTAGAWRWNSVSDSLTSDEATTFNADLFYINDNITLSVPAAGDVASIASVTCSEGGMVTDNHNGTYKITFGSIYYNKVTVTITFNLESGGTSTKKMVIKRAGMYNSLVTRTGEYNDATGFTLWNSSIPTTGYTALHYQEGESKRAYTTFYTGEYHNNGDPISEVGKPYGIFAKYKWTDGTVSTRVITDCVYGYENDGDQGEGQYFCAYQLWSDTETKTPQYVDVTVLMQNPASGTSFGGVGYGSNAGERWQCTIPQ